MDARCMPPTALVVCRFALAVGATVFLSDTSKPQDRLRMCTLHSGTTVQDCDQEKGFASLRGITASNNTIWYAAWTANMLVAINHYGREQFVYSCPSLSMHLVHCCGVHCCSEC